MLKKIYIIILFFSISLSAFTQKFKFQVIRIANLENSIFEASGLAFYKTFLWTLNDGGNSNALFKLDTNGNIIKKVVIKNAVNYDWEELTQDDENFYIGDFGNNSGKRQNLSVIIVKKNDAEQFDTVISDIMYFKYNDQKSFKNKRHKHNFDCEAMVCYYDKLVLFSKNWKDKKTKVYTLDKKSKNQTALLIDSFDLKLLVTGAAFCPNSGKIALLGYKYNKIRMKSYIVEISEFNDGKVFNGKVKKKNLHLFNSQTEAITFTDDNDHLYMTREGIRKKNLTISKPRLYKLIRMK